MGSVLDLDLDLDCEAVMLFSTESDYHATPIRRQSARQAVADESRESQGYIETKSSTPQKLPKAKVEKIGNDIIDIANHAWQATPIVIEENVSVDSFFEVCEFLELQHFHCRPRVALKNGKIIFVEYPSPPHEIVLRCIEQRLGAFNEDISDSISLLFPLGSSRTIYGPGNVFETDCSFQNGFNQPQGYPKDARGATLPIFIIEVGFSESVTSLTSTAEIYLQNPVVQMVISIKLLGKYENNIHNVHTMICLVHEKNPENQQSRITRVINFGPPRQIRRLFVDSIENATNFPREHFEGVDFTYFGAYPFEGNHPTFSITVPSRIIWHGVPQEIVEDARHNYGEQIMQDFNLDLARPVRHLIQMSHLRLG